MQYEPAMETNLSVG